MKKISILAGLLVSCSSFAQTAPNPTLIARLDSVYTDDQLYRRQEGAIQKQYGFNSKELQAAKKLRQEKDSVNLIKVCAILDQYGWLGPDAVGEQGNKTLFLVIQHSNQATQEKYLPMMKEAVKKGHARASSFALLQDRVATGQGKMQIYGSQVLKDSTGNYVDPIEDVDNVDKRRAEVGLQPLAEYLKQWNITWSVEQYKKDLPQSPAYKRWLAYREYLEAQKKK
jgi:hypothetical protein